MPGSDDILAIAALFEKAPPGVLATISSVRGSAPAPVLSRLYLSASGETTGTIGGGCLEAEVLLEAQRVGAEGGWRRVVFTLNETEEELRMVCGGTVEILLEKVAPEDGPMFRALAARHASGQTTLLARIFEPSRTADGARPDSPSSRCVSAGSAAPARLLLGEEGERLWGACSLPGAHLAAAVRAIHEERAAWLDEGRLFLEPVVGRPRVVVFGGGHVSRAVYAVARAAGFRVAVADDRPKYAAPERFPEAQRFVVPSYLDCVERVGLVPHDFVLVMTRGHQYDEEILEQILRAPPTRYLGVIGSRRKHHAAETRLLARGIPEERLRAVHGPVGLAIGAVTPEEIAIAIVGEMIAVRRGVAASREASGAGRDEAGSRDRSVARGAEHEAREGP